MISQFGLLFLACVVLFAWNASSPLRLAKAHWCFMVQLKCQLLLWSVSWACLGQDYSFLCSVLTEVTDDLSAGSSGVFTSAHLLLSLLSPCWFWNFLLYSNFALCRSFSGHTLQSSFWGSEHSCCAVVLHLVSWLAKNEHLLFPLGSINRSKPTTSDVLITRHTLCPKYLSPT